MLYLIGLGLGDEKDLSFRGAEVARRCDCYAEFYTSKWSGSVKALESLVGNKITILQRKDLEDDLGKFLDVASKRDTALFVVGDPLAATTHLAILSEARRRGIDVSLIHNASVFSVLGETGLQLYKFGRTASVPRDGSLESLKSAVLGNKSLGLHTLLILDIGLPIEEAVKKLVSDGVLGENEKLVVLSRAGCADQKIGYLHASQVSGFSEPAVLIVPGKLHFTEEDFLRETF